MIRATHRTDTGKLRPQNEDAVLADPGGLYVVADGMGGRQAGEVASGITVQTLREALAGVKVSPRALADAVRLANQRVCEDAQLTLEHRGMGTTVTALWADQDFVLIAQVGDSRAYLMREGKLHRCTRDHTLVDELVRSGTITQAQARHHPQRSMITRALGTSPRVSADIFEWDRCKGDVWLLCSDGLTDMVDDAAIAGVLACLPLEEACDELMDRALDAGGVDNITILLLQDEGEVGE